MPEFSAKSEAESAMIEVVEAKRHHWLLAEALAKTADARSAVARDEAALPEIPKSDAESYDGSPI